MVSIVLPAKNHLRDLTIPCVRAIRKNTCYPYELICIDDGSSDGTFRYFQRVADKAFRHRKNRGVAAARNTGIKAAAGDYVYTMDNDVFVYPGWLTQHMKEHAKNPAAILGDIPSDEKHKLRNPRARDGLIYVDQLASAAMCIPGYVFGRIGGFDEGLPVASDTDFCFRARLAGIEIALAPTVILQHKAHGTQKSDYKKQGIIPFQRKWAGKLNQFSWR